MGTKDDKAAPSKRAGAGPKRPPPNPELTRTLPLPGRPRRDAPKAEPPRAPPEGPVRSPFEVPAARSQAFGVEDTRKALEKSSSLPPAPAGPLEKTEVLSAEEMKHGRDPRRTKRRDAPSKREAPSRSAKAKGRPASSELSRTLPLAGAARRPAPAHAKKTPSGLVEKTLPLAQTKRGRAREPSTRSRTPASPAPSPPRGPARPLVRVPVEEAPAVVTPGPGVMRGATLRRARLVRADLRGGDLRGANLTEADLGHADLSLARLDDADLSFANLHETKLEGAETRGSKRSGTRNVDPDRR